MAFANVSNRSRGISNSLILSNKQDTLGSGSSISISSGTFGTLQYRKPGDPNTILNVATKVQSLEDKLDGTATVLSEGGVDYTMQDLLSTVVANKAKFTSFTDAVNGAVGDENTGVVSLMEQVSQNKADIAVETGLRQALRTEYDETVTSVGASIAAAEASAKAFSTANLAIETAARAALSAQLETHVENTSASLTTLTNGQYTNASKIQTLAGTRYDTVMVEGEGDSPVFSCGSVPMEVGFGIPINGDCELVKCVYLARSSFVFTGGESMTLDFVATDASGLHLWTSQKTFTGQQDFTSFTLLDLPENGMLEVRYASKVGTNFSSDARFRLSLLMRRKEGDGVLVV